MGGHTLLFFGLAEAEGQELQAHVETMMGRDGMIMR